MAGTINSDNADTDGKRASAGEGAVPTHGWTLAADADLRITECLSFDGKGGPALAGLVGRPLQSLICDQPIDLPAEIHDRYRGDLERRRPIERLSYVHHFEGGSTCPVALSLAPSWGAEGSFLGYRGAATVAETTASPATQPWVQDMVDALGEGFILFDADERLVLINRRFRELYSPNDRFYSVGALVEDVARGLAESGAVEEAVGREEEWIAERLAKHRSGDARFMRHLAPDKWLLTNDRRTRDGGVVTVVHDVSDIKRTEEEANRKQMRFERLLEFAPDAMLILDGEGLIREANAETRALFGYETSELIGEPVEMLLPERLRARHVGDRSGFIDRGGARPMESGRRLTARAKSGREFTVEISLGRHVDAGEIEITAAIRDISEREWILETLHESQENVGRMHVRLREAIEAMPAGFWLFDADERLVLCNQIVRDHFPGLDPLWEPGTSMSTIVPEIARRYIAGREEDWAAWSKERLAIMRAGTPVEPLEVSYADGRWFQEIDRRTSEGGIVSLRLPITELKQREAELARAKSEADAAHRSKSLFFASMSHELRTPLNGVIAYSDLISGAAGAIEGAEQCGEYAGMIKECGTHLLRLINDILDLSKLEAGKFTLQKCAVRIASIADAAIRMTAPQAGKGDVTVTLETSDTVPDIHGDERRLLQVMINLLSNAIGFTEPGGRVTVEVGADGRGCVVRVIDTGVGIAPEDIPRVLEPFRQAGNGRGGTALAGRDGTGLGLPLSKSLVELHGGTLTLESERGIGTTVTIRLATPTRAVA